MSRLRRLTRAASIRAPWACCGRAGAASLMRRRAAARRPRQRRRNPYNANHTADPDPRKRWDGQYPSIWVTDGGGGTFTDIWTPSTYAQAGFYVSDTKTPGHVYEMSAEHHVRTEIEARPRRELGLPRAADRGGIGREPGIARRSKSADSQQHHRSPTTTPTASRARARRIPAAVRLCTSPPTSASATST